MATSSRRRRHHGRGRAAVRLAAVALATALVLSACSGADPGEGTAPAGAAGADDDVASALDDMRDPSFPSPLIDPDQVRSGGPPPDGIPPIDEPKFAPASEIRWLDGDEPVLSLTVGGETRAYPLQVMTWHEIVNDTVGDVPVAVTYCPLCNSGVAFEREAAGRLLTFGTSGRLYNDNLVMYDRQTESLWPQLTGQASIGALTGTRLVAIPMGTVAWDDFREAHPEALVLTRDTGHSRPYGRNPYVGYDDPDSPPLFGPAEPTDPRLAAKVRVVGVEVDGDTLAVTRELLAREGVTELTVGGRRLVAFHTPGQLSALDSERIAQGADIGTVAVYEATLQGDDVSFEADGRTFVDSGTGSRWDVLGRAVSGPLEGEELTPVQFLDTFWFVWFAFHPATELRA